MCQRQDEECMSQSPTESNDLLGCQPLAINKCKKSGAWSWKPSTNPCSKTVRTGSGRKNHATLHSRISGTGQVQSGSSSSTSKATSITSTIRYLWDC